MTFGRVEIDSQMRMTVTPLLWAVENRHEAVVKLLLARDEVELNSEDSWGKTPLLWTAAN